MKAVRRIHAVRRSVVLPAPLVDQLEVVLASEPEQNLNRLVIAALRDYLERRRQDEFRKAMAEMASDPSIHKESKAISRDFAAADADGL